MTQRTWERISGWVAVACWCTWLLFAALGVTILVQAQHPAAVASPSAAAVQHSPGKRPAPAPGRAAGQHQAATDAEIAAEGLGFVALLAFVCALAATSWWRWRRRQRVRAEIRVEAWRGPALARTRRDSAAVTR